MNKNIKKNNQEADVTSPAVAVTGEGGSRVWDLQISKTDQAAIDRIVEHMIKTGAMPSVRASGSIADVLSSVGVALQKSLPEHLMNDVITMMDYMAVWLCDYAEETGSATIKAVFGFNVKPEAMES